MICPNKKCSIGATVGVFCCVCGSKLVNGLKCKGCGESEYLCKDDKICRWCGDVLSL